MSGIRNVKGIFRKFHKKAKSQTEQYVFLGNGASGIDYDKLQRNPKLEAARPGAGTRKYIVFTKHLKKVKAERLFHRQQADFMGYYAALRVDRQYLWYATDGAWYTLSELMTLEGISRHLFLHGDDIGLHVVKKQTIYLFAQWKDQESGRRIHGGYQIFRHPLMAHALGAYQGQNYSNTREALEYAYAQGYRYFEADVAITEDNCLVLSHGWSESACKLTGMEYKPEFEHMTRELFMQQCIGSCHVMDITDLKNFMQQHEDTYFEIDSHRVDVADKMEILLEVFEYDDALLNRLLIQAESRNIFKEIDKVYHFDNYQLIFGKEWIQKLEQGITFALDHGIETIAMRHDLWYPEMVALFHETGLWVMAYTVKDDVEEVKRLLAMGVDTICTDEVKQSDIDSMSGV